jgi:hypothetical protein
MSSRFRQNTINPQDSSSATKMVHKGLFQGNFVEFTSIDIVMEDDHFRPQTLSVKHSIVESMWQKVRTGQFPETLEGRSKVVGAAHQETQGRCVYQFVLKIICAFVKGRPVPNEPGQVRR